MPEGWTARFPRALYLTRLSLEPVPTDFVEPPVIYDRSGYPMIKPEDTIDSVLEHMLLEAPHELRIPREIGPDDDLFTVHSVDGADLLGYALKLQSDHGVEFTDNELREASTIAQLRALIRKKLTENTNTDFQTDKTD